MPVTKINRKIRSRAPLRLGLAGGGTDLSPFCDEFGGAVLNVTIDRFAFASILPDVDNKIVFCADDMRTSESFDLDAPLDKASLVLHRGVYERMISDYNGGVRCPMTIKTTVDAPPGSGLGSSSALVVALVEVFRESFGLPLGPYDVARLAFEIERIDLGLAGGRQDQYAAAFGGINFIEFLPHDRVIVNPMRVATAITNEVESSVVICFSGRSRESANIIDRQTTGMKSGSKRTMEAMHSLKSDAIDMKNSFLKGDIGGMAEILNRSWAAKRATAEGVSTPHIDVLLERAAEAGALAGKVSGAGGGGFVFFITHPEHRFRLIEVLNEAGGVAAPTKFSDRGCEAWQFG